MDVVLISNYTDKKSLAFRASQSTSKPHFSITAFRITVSIALLILPIYLGYRMSSPLIILPLGIVFLLGYIGGKWNQWKTLFSLSSATSILTNVAVSYLVQCLLASILFFAGLGVGKLLTDHSMKTGITNGQWVLLACAGISALAASALLIRFGKQDSIAALKTNLEETAPDFTSSPGEDDEPEIEMLDKVITEENFFYSRHFTVSDHSRSALKDWPQADGTLIARSPVAASEAMITRAEKRLGFSLPETLRSLYRIRNGGSLPTYWVPAVENPGGEYDDWIDAFANDYNDLRPLDSLVLLQSDYLEHFDPEYDDLSDKESWFPGSEKLVVLTQRYGVATLLDYRTGKTAPGVLLVNLDNEPEKQVRTQFESFDAFFEALREEKDFYARNPNADAPDRNRLRDTGYTPDAPHQFWASSSSNASDGVSDHDWNDAEERLGLPLPESFKAPYEALDGGVVAHPFHPELGTDEDGAPRSPFSGQLYTVAGLLPLQSWITLEELSSRLDFQGEIPYSEVHEKSDNLIVIATSYDTALLLDYRNGESAEVLYQEDLTNPASGTKLGTAPEFLSALRRREAPFSNDPAPIADATLSPRVMSSDTFWHPDTAINGVSEQELEQAAARFGKAVPEQIATLLKRQNGGNPRFQYLPPIGTRKDPMGRSIADSNQTQWAALFPGGILPIKEWKTIYEFRENLNHALEQDIRETLMPEMITEPNVEERLLVIGHSDEGAITLLDLSEGSFKRTPYLSRADYSKEGDEYQLTIAPLSTEHYTHGALQLLRAKVGEL